MRFDHPFTPLTKCVVVDWGRSSHHRDERRTVPIRRPDLEVVVGLRTEGPSIGHQWLDSGGRGKGVYCHQFRMKGVEQQLKSCEPLLAIDDRAYLHQAKRILNLLKNYSSQEVRLMFVGRILEQPSCNANDVVPEWLPLVFLALLKFVWVRNWLKGFPGAQKCVVL